MEELLPASQPDSQDMTLGSMGRALGSRSKQPHWRAMEPTGSRVHPCSSLSR